MITGRELRFRFSGKHTVRRPHLIAVLEPGTQPYIPVNVENMLPEQRPLDMDPEELTNWKKDEDGACSI